MTIGISGFAGSGKTEAARYLEQRYGYERQHIAEPLRRMLRSLLRDFGMPNAEIDRYLTGDLKEAVIPCLGITSRKAQITLGTEWGRKQVSQDLWARLWDRQAAEKSMNESVRFPNEEDAIRVNCGFTIMLIRPGTRPAAFRWGWLGRVLYRCGLMWGVHDSERTDRLRPNYVIANDGTIDDIHRKIDAVMRRRGISA